VKTAAHVAAVAREMGYKANVVARGLRSGRSSTVGVLVADLENTYITPVIHGIADALESQGYMALVVETQDDHDRLVRLLDRLLVRRIDALITSAARLGDAEALTAVHASGTPVVLAVRGLHGSGLPMVVHDDVRGGQIAATHLADLGHRRVAQLAGPRDIEPFARRTRGFATRARELSLEDVTVDEAAQVPSASEGRRLMLKTMSSVKPLPTAVFAQNDLMALGAVEALSAAGLRCPRDISVIGYNDAPLMDHTFPALTTIRLNSREIGRIAALTALAAIEDPRESPKSSILPPQLIVRDSTASPQTVVPSQPPRSLPGRRLMGAAANRIAQ